MIKIPFNSAVLSTEGEEHDHTTLDLQENQQVLVEAVLAYSLSEDIRLKGRFDVVNK
jgi:hypothetical protein